MMTNVYIKSLLYLLRYMWISQAVPVPGSIKLKVVHKQLYCDTINSYWTLDFVGCATQCLRVVSSCEGISLEKQQSLNKYACNVCLVKAVRRRMKSFTVPANNTRIYQRLIDMQKGITLLYFKYMYYTVRCRYITVDFPPYLRNRHSIFRPHGRTTGLPL